MASDAQLLQPEGLSTRALEILSLLAEGLSDREVSERLVLTINTVKWYNRQIYSILGVGSRTQAIARARELQLLDTGEVAAPAVSPPRPRHNLPVETTRFIGRSQQMDSIQHLLETMRLLTLVGPPGTGKTRLALQVARETAGTFADGVYFVSLAPISDPALVTHAIASAVGVQEVQGQPVLETLKQALRESHLLLVLDNFEHLLPAGTQISELLSTAPHLKVLATSREPLHLYGEQEYAVPPLELPDPQHVEPERLLEYEATALFVQRARAVRPSFELTAENAEDVAHICLRLEGLPLAIELAAARIKLLTPRTLLARLASRLDTLTGGAQDLPTRQQTLHNTIAWSYNLLNDGEQMFFARLAVFRGGCSLEAMEAVCGPELPLPLLDGLESLVNKSLLQQHELPSGEPRFTMLETLHEYAWQRLRERAEHGEITGRHSTYYLELVTQHEAALYGMEPLAVVAALRPELDNIRQAWQWLSSRALAEPTLLPALHTAIDGLAAFYEVASLFEEGAAVFARAAEGMAQEPASSEMEGVVCHLLARVAEFCEWRGEMAHAYEVAVQVLEMTGRLDLPRYRAQALQTLGILKRDTGEVEEAVQHLQEAIEIYTALGLHRPLALTNDWLGLIVSDLGRPDEAMDYLARAATLYAAAGNERGMVFNKGMMGVVLAVTGRLGEALAYQREVLAGYQKLEYPLGEGRTANNVSLILLEIGHFAEALVQMEHALQIAAHIGNTAGYYNSLGNKGEILIALAQYEEAQACLEETGRYFREMGLRWLESENLWRQGLLLLKMGQLQEAHDALTACLELSPAQENPESFAIAHSLLAQVAWRSGRVAAALEHFTQAATLYHAVRRPLTAANLLFIPWATLLLEQGDFAAAEAVLANVWPLMGEAGRHPLYPAAHQLQAKINAGQAERPPVL